MVTSYLYKTQNIYIYFTPKKEILDACQTSLLMGCLYQLPLRKDHAQKPIVSF